VKGVVGEKAADEGEEICLIRFACAELEPKCRLCPFGCLILYSVSNFQSNGSKYFGKRLIAVACIRQLVDSNPKHV